MPLCGRFIRLIRAIRRSGETGGLANMQQFKNMASNDEKRTRIDRCLHLPKGGRSSRNGSCTLFNLTYIILKNVFVQPADLLKMVLYILNKNDTIKHLVIDNYANGLYDNIIMGWKLAMLFFLIGKETRLSRLSP